MRSPLFFVLFILPLLLPAQNVNIVAVSPTGTLRTIDQCDMITVTFSEPMVGLKALSDSSANGLFTISPAVAGRFRWQGTSTLSFIPDQRLKFSSTYTVSLPKGIRAVSGRTLNEPFEWKFNTPLLAIRHTQPGHGEAGIGLDETISLAFNQPVDAAKITRSLSVELRRDGAVLYPAYALVQPTVPGMDMTIRTKEQFHPGDQVSVTVRRDAHGTEGTLGSAYDATFSFSVRPKFHFNGLRSDTISPGSPIVFLFTTRTSRKQLLSHLRITPDVGLSAVQEDEDNEYEWRTDEWVVSVNVKPVRKYSGIILPGMKDEYGQVLTDTIHFEFHTRDFEPYFEMPTGYGIVESYLKRRLPVTLVNMSGFRLAMAPVDVASVIEFRRTGTIATPNFKTSRFVRPSFKKNVVGYEYILLDTVLQRRSHTGFALVRADFSETENTALWENKEYNALVNVTNIGVTAKTSQDDILIWATRLKDAAPVPSADVELRNDNAEVIWKGKTGKDGVAKAPGWGQLKLGTVRSSSEEYRGGQRPRLWVVVRKGEDAALISSADAEGLSPWQFGISYDWSPTVEQVRGSVFTDRGLYKAGENVHIKGVVRVLRRGVWKVLARDSVRIVMNDPQGQELHLAAGRTSDFGGFSTTAAIPASASLGYYSVSFELYDATETPARWMHINSTSARVEAFRAAEFDVTTVLDAKSYIVGDTAAGMVSAKYLFGAPMNAAPVKWRFTTSSASYDPPGWDQYWFGADWYSYRYNDGEGRLFHEMEDTLSADGTVRALMPVNVGEVRRTSSLLFEADVQSPSRQSISGRSSVILHAGEFYPGIGMNSTFIQKDSAVDLRLIAARPDGSLMPDIPLTLRITRRYWYSVRRAEVGGRYYWNSVMVDTLMDSSVTVSGTAPVTHRYIPRMPGYYVMELSGTDARGNHVSGNSYFYVTGSGYVPWERSNDDRIDLVLEGKNYVPGQTARIMVKNPYEIATALVTVEREGILSHFTRTLTGSAPQIEIPITADHLPNIFVSVVLLQGRVDSIAATKDADVGRPSFKIGYVNIPVSPLSKKLSVTVQPARKDYRPGDTVDVTVSTLAQNGKPVRAEAVLSVADLGVLNLIGYRLPELFDTFYGERPLSVATAESRSYLIEQRNFGEKAEDIGGGGAAKMMAEVDANGVRKDFRPSAYWNPSIVTGADGKATVRFKLPDNLTAFKLMAAAHTAASEFGYGDNEMTVSKPLLMQPAIPRFARVGDRFQGGVVVLNYGKQPVTVRVSARVTGVTLVGADTATVTLAPGASKEVRFALRADRIGSATFVFRAVTENDEDGVQWKIPVIEPRLREAVATSGTIMNGQVNEQVRKPEGTYEELGSVDAAVNSTQLIGLKNSVQYLFEYPYGCLEQQMSRVIPIVIGADMVKAFGLEVLKGQDERAIVQNVLDEVPLYQQGSGGFTYWKRNWNDPSPYLSAYTMYGLTLAKQKGYRVDAGMFQRGLQYIRGILTGEVTFAYSWEVDATTRAMVMYVLALNGKPEHGYMEKLFQEREKVPLQGRAYLLRALSASNADAGMISSLIGEMLNMAKYAQTTAHFEERVGPDWWWMYYSNVNTTALVTRALIETIPQNEFIPKAVRWLMEQQRNGTWRNTHEDLLVVDALAAYFAVYEKEVPSFTAQVKLAGKEVLRRLFNGRTFETANVSVPFIEIPAGDQPLEIAKQGTGRLYYTLRLNYFPKGPTIPKDEGFSIVRTVEKITADSGDIPVIAAGTVSRVTLVLSTKQDRPFVVVDDPLPAGFEIVNTSFQTESNETSEAEGTLAYQFTHRELRDDRALFFADYLPAGVHTLIYFIRTTSIGQFTHPAVRVEQMYEPEVFGQSGSGSIIVK